MKAIKEIGFKKTVKFITYSLVQILYHNLIDHLFYFSHARKLFLTILGARIGSNTIMMNVHFFNWHHRGPKGLKIGKDCFLGDEILIDLYNDVVLEDQVTIAQRVTVITHMNVGYKDHPMQKFFHKISKPVVFKKGSVIGAGSIILPGISVGENSFVGAGSVVTRDIPPNNLFVGNPAKFKRKIK